MPTQSRATGAISLLGAQATVLLLGWLTHPIIGRLLGREPYGIFGVVLSIQSIAGIFLTLGIPVAISRFVAQNSSTAQSTLKQGIRWQIIFGLIIAGITFIVAPSLANLLNDTSLTNLIRFSGFVVLTQTGYPVYTQFLSGMHRFNRQAALTVIYAITKLIGSIALIFTFAVYGALGGFAIGGIFAAFLGFHWTRSLGDKQPQKLPAKKFLSFAGTYVLILVGLQLLISLDLFMVKSLLKDDALAGDYSAAVTLARIPYLLLQGLAFIILPSVSTLTKPGASQIEAAKFIQNTLRYLIAIIVPGALLAATTSRELIRLFYSSQFISAAPALSILMIGLSLLAFYLLLANIVAGAGRARVALWLTGSLLIISIALGSHLTPKYGLVGAAWQTTLTSFIGFIVLSYYTFKTFHIPVPWRATTNIVIAASLAVSPTYLWQTPALLLPLLYLAAGIIYILALIMLGEVKTRDRQLIAGFHPKLSWLYKP